MNTYREAVEDARGYGFSPTYKVKGAGEECYVVSFWKHEKMSSTELNNGNFVEVSSGRRGITWEGIR